MPGAGQAAADQLALGQWPRHVAAAVGQNLHLIPGADGNNRHFADHLADRLALWKVGWGRQVMPARLYDVRDVLGVIGAPSEPERNVAAENAAKAGGRQPGQAEAAASPRGAGKQRCPVEGGGEAVCQRMDHADAHLLFVLLRPVDRASDDRGRRGHKPRGHQAPCRRVRPRHQQVQRAGRHPGAYRHLHEHGVQRVAKPHSVQRVPDPAGPDGPGGLLADRDRRVKLIGILKPRDESHAPALPTTPWVKPLFHGVKPWQRR